ncbi:aromatic amino acid lyase [Natrarchaeobius halalkaliphilus]|uniref:Aromatic amino acid lyase n=1 Tax=Natrarchaeobius halalkaliphilus TaxID=1679091 RepID=A0A3N6M469_9EURY|nr:aromatic amino acid ammonia-lyase [Natrarchaeobius halalkaliphilus]RQG86947.1 aromatic amino acid lyase [Natrarchaeobius halalkaliphilus]
MIELTGTLSTQDIVAIARGNAAVSLPTEAVERMERTRAIVDDVVRRDDYHVYGVNAGVGDLHEKSISRDRILEMQENIIESSITGVEPLASTEITRAAMATKANTFATGRSGARPELVQKLCAMLNEGVHPRLYLGGSTDDLTAIAHVGLVLLGKGTAELDGEVVSGGEALERADIDPVQLAPKEAMSIVSGTSVMTGMLSLCVRDVDRLVRTADIVSALTFELIGDAPETFASRVSDVRPHDGHATTATNVRTLLDGNVDGSSPKMVQDPLSLRVIPQVHGTVRSHLSFARETVDTELRSASDNPLVFPDGKLYSCGTFNGQPISSAADSLRSVVIKLGSISESRNERLLQNRQTDYPFLAADPGVESGLMMTQYTSSGLLAETLATDGVSTSSVTVSGGQEDIHSMGTISVRALADTVETVGRILAIELLCANRYHNLVGDISTTTALEELLEYVNAIVQDPIEDEPAFDHIASLTEAVLSGTIVDVVESTGVDID